MTRGLHIGVSSVTGVDSSQRLFLPFHEMLLYCGIKVHRAYLSLAEPGAMAAAAIGESI